MVGQRGWEGSWIRKGLCRPHLSQTLHAGTWGRWGDTGPSCRKPCPEIESLITAWETRQNHSARPFSARSPPPPATCTP